MRVYFQVMPYASNSSLPESIRSALPDAAQSRWRSVFNDRVGAGESEQSAIRQAWYVVNQGWEKNNAGDWVRKVSKAEYQGREVELDKPFRLPSGSSKKFGVYVKDGDSVKRVTFGDPNMEIRRDDPEARASFRARHSCDTQKDKTSAAYWSCRMWSGDFSVSDELSKAEASVPIEATVAKVDDSLGLVFGWAIVSEINGEPYIDTQGDYIPSDVAMKAIAKFMEGERVAKTMHVGERTGTVVMAWPMVSDVMKAMEIESQKTGVMIAMKPDSQESLAKFRDGTFTGFSIGGSASSVELMDA